VKVIKVITAEMDFLNRTTYIKAKITSYKDK